MFAPLEVWASIICNSIAFFDMERVSWVCSSDFRLCLYKRICAFNLNVNIVKNAIYLLCYCYVGHCVHYDYRSMFTDIR